MPSKYVTHLSASHVIMSERPFFFGVSLDSEVKLTGQFRPKEDNFRRSYMPTITGGINGPYRIGNAGDPGCTIVESKEAAIAAGGQAAWDAFVAASAPTFVTWTAALTTFQATTPTVGALNSWLASHPPVPD